MTLTSEVKYLQSRLFKTFITDQLGLLHNEGKAVETCTKDILELILNQFNIKFSQKMYTR